MAEGKSEECGLKEVEGKVCESSSSRPLQPICSLLFVPLDYDVTQLPSYK